LEKRLESIKESYEAELETQKKIIETQTENKSDEK
jgi:hypothetical protein